ncbi:MAG: NBR1-Ig-like domain-containing protein [Ignavibacteria bacterium]|nr:NBR1-Ig-like domain-containing protein [Ignavibacteria bacterium]
MIKTNILKHIFISSTVYDLKDERTFVKTLLENYDGMVRFKCIASEANDFPITPEDLVTKHSYSICVDKIRHADYFFLFIKKRYGDPIIEHMGDFISITHREYREAYKKKLPLFIFVNQQTWDSRNSYKKDVPQNFVSKKHIKIFDFIDEITNQLTNNWIFFYKDTADIENHIKNVLFNFDDSIFISETIPDGKIVEINEEFQKTWELKNNGCTIWENRFLQEVNSNASGLTPSDTKIPIPTVLPNEIVKLAINFKAPKYPCICESYWKMVDSLGKRCFPNKKGIWCKVKVEY